MKLVLDAGGGRTEKIHMELPLPQFYAFMHEMEKAKAGLELLSWLIRKHVSPIFWSFESVFSNSF